MSQSNPIELAAVADADDTCAFARQPVLDTERVVFGFELFNRSRLPGAHSSASDAALLFNALTHPDNAALLERRVLFINCTPASLKGGHLELVEPSHVVLKLSTPPGAPPEDIEALRPQMAELASAGFRFAFNATVLAPAYSSWMALASFVKVDMSATAPPEVASVMRRIQQEARVQVVARKIETAEQFELARHAGAKLFQGHWFGRPQLVKGQSIRPGHASIIQIINLVRRKASTAEIEEVLKRDPSLSFNLLRLINSASFGMSCEVTSFRHAIMILGLQKLYRWAAMLLTTSKVGSAPPNIGSTAIVRGRLMELLAAELLPPEDCDNAFVAGMFSMLDAMLGMPMDKALASLSLPEAVTELLLHRRGTFAPFLDLTLACESADDLAFAKSANALQLTSQQVNMAHLQALAWAETLGSQ